MSQIFNDDEFKQLDFNKQKEILSNYFNSELVDDEFKILSDSEQSKIKDNFLIKSLTDIGAIKPREDGAGFLTRTKFSFADTDKGRRQVLEDEYGKGNAIKVDNRWLVYEGKEKGWNAVDEKSLSWKDITADWIGDIPEMVGGGAGAIAGTGWGSIPLAAAGSAGGAGIKKLIAKALGIKDEQTAIEIAEDLGKSAAMGGVGQGVGLGIVKGANKVLSPFKNKMTPDAIARRELAQKYGAELTPAQVTQSPMLSRLENALNSGFTGGRISDIKNSQFETLQGHLNNTFDEIIKGKTNEEIGLDIVKMLDDSMKLKKADFNQKYGELASKIGNDIPIDKAKQKAIELLEKSKNVPQSLQGDSLKTSREISMLPDNIDYNTFSETRSALGEKARAGGVTGDIGTGKYQQLKSSFTDSFKDFANKNGLGTDLQELDSFYRAFKDDYESGIVNKILKNEQTGNIIPSNVGNNTVSNITNTKRVAEALGGNKEPLQEALASKIMKGSAVANPSLDIPFSNYFSASKLNTEIGKNKDTFEYAFSDAQKNKINDLVKLGKDISLEDKVYGNPSGTGKTVDAIITTGLLTSDPTLAATNLGGRYLGTRAYTSDIGRKYLTDGLGQINLNNKFNKSFGAAFAPLLTPSYNQD